MRSKLHNIRRRGGKKARIIKSNGKKTPNRNRFINIDQYAKKFAC
jgi:hypothetical protein